MKRSSEVKHMLRVGAGMAFCFRRGFLAATFMRDSFCLKRQRRLAFLNGTVISS